MNLVELAQGINHVLLEVTIASSAALVVVLLLRQRLRSVFGASVAYAGWLLLPVASIAVLLPAAATNTGMIPVVHRVAVMPIQVVVANAEPGIHYAPWLCTAWLLGVVLAMLYFMRQQRRFRATLGRLQTRNIGLQKGLQQAEAVAGLPAAIGWIKPMVVLPADFDTRYSTEQRGLMLAHEQAHIRHGDLQANAAYLAFRCLFWFNPLIHFAAGAFRHDQELACDERVIARHPQSRRAYGEAMFRTQLAAQPMPLGCHWGLTHPLKERIEMIKQPAMRPAWRIGGLGLVLALSLGTGFAAWSAQPAGAQVSQGGIGEDFRLDVAVSSDGKAERHFSINSPYGQPFTLKDDDRGSAIELTGNVRPVTQHGALFFQIATILRHEGEPDKKPMMVIGQGDTGTVQVGKRMPDGRFDGVQIAMQVTPRDAAKALSQAPAFEPSVISRPTTNDDAGVRAIATPPPKYPKTAAEQGVRGKVQLVLDIAADGTVSKTRVESAEPAGVFDEAALETVKQWKFAPATKAGKPVASRIRVPIWFEPPKPPKG